MANIEVEREKYRNSLEVERRKAELAFINDQIRYLYGPLFALDNASNAAFRSFAERYAKGRETAVLEFASTTETKEGIRQWRLWMQEVIMPINLRMEDTITSNSRLIVGRRMSKAFLDFLAHVGTYKAVIINWGSVPLDAVESMSHEDRVTLHTSVKDFPKEFDVEIRDTFATLKERQQSLLSATQTPLDVSGQTRAAVRKTKSTP